MDLVDDIIIEIGLLLNLRELIIFSNIDTKYRQTLWNNPGFWRLKFIQDYFNIPDYSGNWRDLYLNYGNVYVMGINRDGQLGPAIGINAVSTVPVQIPNIQAKSIFSKYGKTAVIDINDDTYIMGLSATRNYYNTALKLLDYPDAVKAIAFGQYHNLILDNENTVYGVGSNESGESGLDIQTQTTTTAEPIPGIHARTISAGMRHSAIIDLDNKLYMFGDNEFGQIPTDFNYLHSVFDPDEIRDISRAKAVACGGYHTVVMDFQGRVFTTGNNRYGQLGLGDNNHRRKLTQIPNIIAKQISAGTWNTAIIDTNDDVYVMGRTYWPDIMDFAVPTKIQLAFKCKFVDCAWMALALIDNEDNLYVAGIHGYTTITPVENYKVSQVVCANSGVIFIGLYLR